MNFSDIFSDMVLPANKATGLEAINYNQKQIGCEKNLHLNYRVIGAKKSFSI